MPHLTALVTLMAVLLYAYMGIRVGQSRAATGIKAPAITGNADFERVFRVQMNTLEWMPIFLPAMWLTAYYFGDKVAAVGGLVWIVGRVLYMQGYSAAANKRGTGFRRAGACGTGVVGRSAGRRHHGNHAQRVGCGYDRVQRSADTCGSIGTRCLSASQLTAHNTMVNIGNAAMLTIDQPACAWSVPERAAADAVIE